MLIQFVDQEGERRTIGLAKATDAHAQTVANYVEELVSAAITGAAVSRPTSSWVAGLGTAMHAKLVKVGLVPPRPEAGKTITIQEFGQQYEASRVDWSKGTRQQFGLALADAGRFWGADRAIDGGNAGRRRCASG